jgi:predicted PurR-regulated permease PerM
MSEHRQIPEPGELVYTPKPSWAPAFFALGAIGLVCGIYAAGFIFSPFIYAIVGAVFFLAAFRNLVRGAIRDYFRLPRKQQVRGAALPVEVITPPKR